MRARSWGCCLLTLLGLAGAIRTAVADDRAGAETLLLIRARAFEPARLTFGAGRPVHLIIKNDDAELHAFVPDGWLDGINLNVSGNGAPEFGERGLKRIIIPSGGRVELRFTPARPTASRFICDMPGHEMRGTVVIE